MKRLASYGLIKRIHFPEEFKPAQQYYTTMPSTHADQFIFRNRGRKSRVLDALLKGIGKEHVTIRRLSQKTGIWNSNVHTVVQELEKDGVLKFVSSSRWVGI